MARIERFKIKGRRFGWKAGAMYVAVKEYRTRANQDGRLVSFMFIRPDEPKGKKRKAKGKPAEPVVTKADLVRAELFRRYPELKPIPKPDQADQAKGEK